ncbi:DUF2190 family protein [Kaustia mangrovi]|uniref:DUF2190 family protein n=1 Tax=Kaustia mangrovi TaxID=2593653 RepID=A0A7S8C634_9HYPH|nr:DUF2190 family protein [Kaustia mangrovi]QPC44001.1 DUF2190 family protein [Kaustia mangrovi]
MATNYIQPGDILDLTAPAGGVTSGGGYVIGGLFVIALGSAEAGDGFRGKVNGIMELPKVSAQAWAEGEAIYWDPNNAEATTASTAGNYLIGNATAAAANPSSTGMVRLNGVNTVAEA